MIRLHLAPCGCFFGSTRRAFTLICFGLSLTLGFATIGAVAVAQDARPSPASDDAKSVEPFVGEATFLILKIDPSRIELPDADALVSLSSEARAAVAEFSEGLSASVKQMRALADNRLVFATVGIPESKSRLPAFCFRRKTSVENAKNVMAFVTSQLKADAHLRGDYIVATPRGGIPDMASSMSDTNRQAITSAFESVSSYPIQVLILPPDHVVRTVRELAPELPSRLGGGPSSVLTNGIQWAGIGFDPARLRIEVIIQSANEKAARDLATRLPIMLQSGHDAAPPHPQISAELVRLVIGWIKPHAEGSQVKILIDGFEKTRANLALLAGIAQLVEQRSSRHTTVQRFRQILIAMHNYYEVHRTFPPEDKQRDKQGKPRLSWRVHILPFVDESRLYNQFHLDEPWDSQHNKTLIEQMPDVYARSSLDPTKAKIKPGYTTTLAPVGAKTIFGGAKATRMPQITDGTSNTVALLEVTPKLAVPWTAPDDYSFDPKNPLAGILINVDGKWLCAFADGSVHQLPGKIPAKTALHLFQMNDGNPVTIHRN